MFRSWRRATEIRKFQKFQVKSLCLWEEVPSSVHSSLLKLNVRSYINEQKSHFQLKELNIMGSVATHLLENVNIQSLAIYNIPFSIADVACVLQVWEFLANIIRKIKMILDNRATITGGWSMNSSAFTQQELVAWFHTRFTVITSTHQGDLPSARPLVVTHAEFDDYGHHWLITRDNTILEMDYLGREEGFQFCKRCDLYFLPNFLRKFLWFTNKAFKEFFVTGSNRGLEIEIFFSAQTCSHRENKKKNWSLKVFNP